MAIDLGFGRVCQVQQLRLAAGALLRRAQQHTADYMGARVGAGEGDKQQAQQLLLFCVVFARMRTFTMQAAETSGSGLLRYGSKCHETGCKERVTAITQGRGCFYVHKGIHMPMRTCVSMSCCWQLGCCWQLSCWSGAVAAEVCHSWARTDRAMLARASARVPSAYDITCCGGRRCQ